MRISGRSRSCKIWSLSMAVVVVEDVLTVLCSINITVRRIPLSLQEILANKVGCLVGWLRVDLDSRSDFSFINSRILIAEGSTILIVITTLGYDEIKGFGRLLTLRGLLLKKIGKQNWFRESSIEFGSCFSSWF